MKDYHTYFVASMLTENNEVKIYNDVFGTCSKNLELARDVMRFIEQQHPGAMTISISKLD